MIPDKVRNIFTFIDFLNSNKKNYVEIYVPLTNRLLQLGEERSKLSPARNYKEKKQHDIIQKDIEERFSLIQRDVVKPILDNLLNLKIWDGDRIFTSIYNNNIGAIAELTKSFTDADIKKVKKYKQMYLSFRTETNSSFVSLAFLFDYLDELLKVPFDFFKDTESNEFEPFETKPIQVDSISECVAQFKKGDTKFALPINVFNPSNVQQNDSEALPLHPLETHQGEKYAYCTSETFKTDISELCEKCPLIELIKYGITNQIEFQAKEKMEVLTKEQFANYVKGEIENASNAMEKIHLAELQRPNDKKFRGNRLQVYIWNKERIKALNEVLENATVSKRKRFEREFEKADISFTDVITKNPLFKDDLFSQFCNAEKKPCFDLYLADFYSEEELKQGFEEIQKQIPVSESNGLVAAKFVVTTPFESRIRELYCEFANRSAKKMLPLKFYSPDIEKTAIVQTLRAINNEYELLKKSVFDEKTDKYKEAEIRSKNVLVISEGLKGFAFLILERLQRDNENFYLYLEKADKTKSDFWQTLKSNFNNSIIVQNQGSRLVTVGKDDTPTQSEYPETLPIDVKGKQFQFQNNFDKVAPPNIYNHFKAGLVDKGFLTEIELQLFLKAAFESKTIPGERFKFKDVINKDDIQLVFYTYYLNVASKPHKKQKDYAALLGNYFEGYNPINVSTNFAKPYNPRKPRKR